MSLRATDVARSDAHADAYCQEGAYRAFGFDEGPGADDGAIPHEHEREHEYG